MEVTEFVVATNEASSKLNPSLLSPLTNAMIVGSSLASFPGPNGIMPMARECK